MNGGTVLDNLNELAYNNACYRCHYYIDKKCTNKDECIWKCLEKNIKALDIIVNKNVNTALLKQCIMIEYNSFCEKNTSLTQEEYELLKEVLL